MCWSPAWPAGPLRRVSPSLLQSHRGPPAPATQAPMPAQKKAGRNPKLPAFPDPLGKRHPWRPTECTPQVIAAAADLMPVCLRIVHLADYLGVTRRTLHNWLKWGREERDRQEKGEETDPLKANYVDFFLTVKRAIATAVIRVQSAALSGLPGWQGGMTVLERWNPRLFGRKATLEVKERVRRAPVRVRDDTITVGDRTYEPDKLSDDEVVALIRELAQG